MKTRTKCLDWYSKVFLRDHSNDADVNKLHERLRANLQSFEFSVILVNSSIKAG